MMSFDTLLLLRHILTSQVLQVGAPDFKDTAERVAQALIELDDALALAAKEAEFDSVEH